MLLIRFSDVSLCGESPKFVSFAFEDGGIRSLNFAHSAITFSKEGGEVSDGERAVRLYFNKKMTECYYVGPEGEAGNWWRISPDLTAIVKKIVEMPDRKWKTLPSRSKGVASPEP